MAKHCLSPKLEISLAENLHEEAAEAVDEKEDSAELA
jgi:hypothetical protein